MSFNFPELFALLGEPGATAHDAHDYEHTLTYLASLDRGARRRDPKDDTHTVAAHSYRDRFVARQRAKYDLATCFNGEGPLANKVRAFVLMFRGLTEDALPTKARQKFTTNAADLLAQFHHPLESSQERQQALQVLCTEVSNAVFGKSADIIMPAILGGDFCDPATLHTQMRETMGASGPFKRVELFATLDRDLRALVTINPNGVTCLSFWHPQEQVWIAGDGLLQPAGLIESLRAEWHHLRADLGLAGGGLAVEDEMDKLLSKVNRIFDHEASIPAPSPFTVFTRDTKDSSRLVFRLDDYHWFFLNTRGQYQSRSYYLLKGNGLMPLRVGLAELKEADQQRLLAFAHAKCDALIKQCIEQPKAEDLSAGTDSSGDRKAA